MRVSSERAPSDPNASGGHISRTLACGLLLLSLVACAGAPPLPKVDLTDPAWQVWTGQALWKPGEERPALAGDLLTARHENGDIFVSFTKTPLPLFTARTADAIWRIDFVERDRSYSGKGTPPTRFVWFYLPEMLAGAPAPPSWTLAREPADELLLTNAHTGESIRIVLDP